MSSVVPAVSGAKVVKGLERAGFTVVRINGSHHMMRHIDGRNVVVPRSIGIADPAVAS